MPKTYNLYQIDSFTKEKFAGNPAGVITNADGLTESEMQLIAREMNNSETAFIFTPDSSDYDAHLRFFTPTREVPVCGHATIAAHYARAKENNLETTRVYQKTGAGILPIDINYENNDYTITMFQGKPEFGRIIEGIAEKILLSALEIDEKHLLPGCPIQIVSTGHSKVMVGIKNRSLLDSLAPDMGLLSKLSSQIGCNGYYAFTLDKGSDILVHGRMFAPAIGINEDPVTGNANGPLGAYLVHHKIINHNGALFCFNAVQGEAIHRKGRIEVEVRIDKEEPTEVKIRGEAVIAFQTSLIL